MTGRTWRSLRKNDWIVCPGDGLPEQVTATRRYAGGRWWVRTSRHDHYRPAGDPVTVTDRPDCAREPR